MENIKKGITPKWVIKCTKGNIYSNYLNVMNVFFGLTEKEKKIVSLFMELGDFSTENRKIVSQKIGFENSRSLNSLIGRIKNKKALVTDKDNQTQFHQMIRNVYDSVVFVFDSDYFDDTHQKELEQKAREDGKKHVQKLQQTRVSLSGDRNSD